jgi:hypothetical protein
MEENKSFLGRDKWCMDNCEGIEHLSMRNMSKHGKEITLSTFLSNFILPRRRVTVKFFTTRIIINYNTFCSKMFGVIIACIQFKLGNDF